MARTEIWNPEIWTRLVLLPGAIGAMNVNVSASLDQGILREHLYTGNHGFTGQTMMLSGQFSFQFWGRMFKWINYCFPCAAALGERILHLPPASLADTVMPPLPDQSLTMTQPIQYTNLFSTGSGI